MASIHTPIIIDVEASGFGSGSYPIEVGVALADGSRHCYLVSPARSWKHWDERAELMHGITRDTLLTYGRPIADIAWRLNELLHRRTAYSDAWSYDMSWLGRLYDAANMRQAFRIADITELMTEDQRLNWHATKLQVTDDLGLQRHRASGDARILQETWRRLSQRAA
ncbi:MAG: hypothetical protein QNJ91_14285 [Gammaproteobacteria bacterium]|nr:hypothetical protein [Gammaproteobacteria bacterium]